MTRGLWSTLLLCALVALSCRRATLLHADQIKFAHGPHLRAGARCLDCHASVTNPSTTIGANTRAGTLPSEAQCKACHNRPEQQRCDFCHREPRNPRSWPRVDRELVFSHNTHLQRLQGSCESCHGVGSDDSTAASYEPTVTPELAPMSVCTDRCHGEDMRRMACTRCHRSLGRYGLDQLVTVRHGPGFPRRHGIAVRASGNLCAQCHEPTFCTRCHSGATGPALADLEPLHNTLDFVHRGDYLARHSQEARLSQGTCTFCHGVDFCDGCHRASGIGGGVGPRSTHPPGWLDPLSANGHARAARRNILLCASCHEGDATQVCVPCHREGGGAGNPHPPGFAAGFDRRSHAVCTVCHAPGP